MQTQKGLELVLTTVFVEFYDKVVFFVIWPSLINRLRSLSKLFNKMYFLYHAWTFDDLVKFEYLKF